MKPKKAAPPLAGTGIGSLMLIDILIDMIITKVAHFHSFVNETAERGYISYNSHSV